MAALTEDYIAAERQGDIFVLPMAASTKIYKGGLVALDANSDANDAADATGLTMVFGRAEETVDNSSGSAGDKTILVKRGVFAYNNGSAALAEDDLGAVCYIEDDNTVGTDPGSFGVVAGIFLGLDPDTSKAWVDTRANSARGAVGPPQIVAYGVHTWAGGAATTDSISVSGLEPDDVVAAFVSAQDGSEEVSTAVNDAANNQIDLTLDANGADGTTLVNYIVLRRPAGA